MKKPVSLTEFAMRLIASCSDAELAIMKNRFEEFPEEPETLKLIKTEIERRKASPQPVGDEPGAA